jgi:hypothetical protein
MCRRTDVDPFEGVNQEDMKTLAMQQALQLPRDYAEAMAVIGHMRDIVMWKAGLVGPQPVIRDAADVVVSFDQNQRRA